MSARITEAMLSAFFAELKKRNAPLPFTEDARAALAAALSTGEAEGKPRQVLFFASYCGNDNTACSDVRPCPTCLGMSNVYEIPAGTPIKYMRQLTPNWLTSKMLEGLTARMIGKAPKSAAPLPEDTHHGR